MGQILTVFANNLLAADNVLKIWTRGAQSTTVSKVLVLGSDEAGALTDQTITSGTLEEAAKIVGTVNIIANEYTEAWSDYQADVTNTALSDSPVFEATANNATKAKESVIAMEADNVLSVAEKLVWRNQLPVIYTNYLKVKEKANGIISDSTMLPFIPLADPGLTATLVALGSAYDNLESRLEWLHYNDEFQDQTTDIPEGFLSTAVEDYYAAFALLEKLCLHQVQDNIIKWSAMNADVTASSVVIANMASDGILDPTEKKAWRTEWPKLTANYLSILENATTLASKGADLVSGISTSTITTAYNALEYFLKYTADVWAYPDEDYNISSTEFSNKTTTYYNAFKALDIACVNQLEVNKEYYTDTVVAALPTAMSPEDIADAFIEDGDISGFNMIESVFINGTTVLGTWLGATNLGAIKAKMGNVEIDSNGSIYSTGKSTYGDTSDGFFLGYDTDNYKLNIGGLYKNIKWNGEDLSINGEIIDTDNISDNAVTNTVWVFSNEHYVYGTLTLPRSSDVLLLANWVNGVAGTTTIEQYNGSTWDYLKGASPQSVTTGSLSVKITLTAGTYDFRVMGVNTNYATSLSMFSFYK